jgi:hypothetical protein
MCDSSADALSLETSEALLNYWAKKYQAQYFSTTLPAPSVEIGAPDKGPACYLLSENVILIHPAVTPFIKLCKPLTLHELIHFNLFKKYGDPDEPEGQRFQAERQRLWEAGAYADLL